MEPGDKGTQHSRNTLCILSLSNLGYVRLINSGFSWTYSLLSFAAGFDPGTVLSSGWTALMHACDSANLAIIMLLLDHWANPMTKIGAEVNKTY